MLPSAQPHSLNVDNKKMGVEPEELPRAPSPTAQPDMEPSPAAYLSPTIEQLNSEVRRLKQENLRLQKHIVQQDTPSSRLSPTSATGRSGGRRSSDISGRVNTLLADLGIDQDANETSRRSRDKRGTEVFETHGSEESSDEEHADSLAKAEVRRAQQQAHQMRKRNASLLRENQELHDIERELREQKVKEAEEKAETQQKANRRLLNLQAGAGRSAREKSVDFSDVASQGKASDGRVTPTGALTHRGTFRPGGRKSRVFEDEVKLRSEFEKGKEDMSEQIEALEALITELRGKEADAQTRLRDEMEKNVHLLAQSRADQQQKQQLEALAADRLRELSELKNLMEGQRTQASNLNTEVDTLRSKLMEAQMAQTSGFMTERGQDPKTPRVPGVLQSPRGRPSPAAVSIQAAEAAIQSEATVTPSPASSSKRDTLSASFSRRGTRRMSAPVVEMSLADEMDDLEEDLVQRNAELEMELQKGEETRTQLEKRLKERDDAMARLKSELDSAKKASDMAVRADESLAAETAELQEKMRLLEDKNRSLESEAARVPDLQDSLKNMEDELATKTEAAQQLAKQRDELQQLLDQGEWVAGKLKEQLTSKSDEIEKLTTTITTIGEDKTKLQESTRKLQQENEELTATIESLKSSSSALESQLSGLQASNAQASIEWATTSNRVSHLEAQVTEAHRKAEQDAETIRSLKAEKQGAEQAATAAEEQLSKLRAELNAVTQQSSAARDELKRLYESQVEQDKAQQQLTADLEAANSAKTRLEAEVSAAQTAASATLEEHAKAIAELESALASAQQAAAEREGEIETLRAERKTVDEQLAGAHSATKGLEAEVSSLRSTAAQGVLDAADTQKTISGLTQQIEEEKMTIEALSKANKDLAGRVETLQGDIDGMKASSVEGAAAAKDMEDRIASLTAEKEEMSKANKDLAGRVETLQGDIDGMKASSVEGAAAAKGMEDRIASFQNELHESSLREATLQKFIEKLQRENDSLKEELERVRREGKPAPMLAVQESPADESSQ
ncbi:unnamed protein product [Vitrella brassicaformis CCMP3155]|uniref:Uncharacterized protein n=1 Tax=Vitrella brassicaformis (strain CCMP3155) TaxID=1169540 RepID=A0A0G4EJL2_VITBC|nr:unnamed protein product [Vitrella brassicaformis CCMP3155]|eukprot:CEL96946.1 unnamed protein product [Vitrella brassicaformis CCMP3155]